MSNTSGRRRIDEILEEYDLDDHSPEGVLERLSRLSPEDRSKLETRIVIETQDLLRRHISEECTDLKSLHALLEKYEPMLEMMMERERRRALFQSAVIEKTFTGLVWSILGTLVYFIGVGIKQYLQMK